MAASTRTCWSTRWEFRGSCSTARAHHSARFAPGAGDFGRRSQLFERLPVLPRQTGALPIQPALELRRVVHVEAVEERPGVEADGVGRPTRRQRLGELAHIGSDHRRVQAQEAPGGRDGPRAQRPADDMESVPQPVASAGLVALGPEQCEQPLTGAAEVPADREHGEDGLGPALGEDGAAAPEVPSRA